MFLRSRIYVVVISAVALASMNAWADPLKFKSGDVTTLHHKPASAGSASTRAYKAAMRTMHKAMHTPLAGDADVDFVRQMIPHHQGALAMANIQLRYGHDERLKRFSRWIIQAQELEIGFMEQWLRRLDNGAKPKDAQDYYGDVMAAMHHGMMIRYTGNADVDFVRGMIAHHQGAVDMAGIMFTHGSDPELNRLADDIYRSQTYEIAWMQDWLAEHAGK